MIRRSAILLADFLHGGPLAGSGGAVGPVVLLGADARAMLLWRSGDAPLLCSTYGR
jgi:hypothetical protein